jgi:hypothetical protein
VEAVAVQAAVALVMISLLILAVSVVLDYWQSMLVRSIT